MPKLSMGTGSRVLMCHGGPPLCRGPHDSANDSLELKLRPVYVLMQVELQMSTDRPMLLLLDDAAIPWAVPRIEEKSTEWMMTTRKKSVSLGFMTHSVSQVFASPLGQLLEEGCPTRFYLPMPAALEPNIAEIYLRLGLTMNAIRTIATARPQRDVYYACKELGQRLFHLPLGPLGLACLARNSAEDHGLMDTF